VECQDLSHSGIRVLVAVNLVPGTTVYIECKASLLRGYCTVRHCTPRDTTYTTVLILNSTRQPVHQ
jgi:hypothetical protein